MSKFFKVSEVAEKFAVSEGVIRNAMSKPVVGEVYVEGYINQKAVRTYLAKKFGVEKVCSTLEVESIDEIELIKGVKAAAFESIDMDDLEVGGKYILRNYHFETNAVYVGFTTVGKVDLWIFNTSKGYKAIDKSIVNNGHFKVIADEAE